MREVHYYVHGRGRGHAARALELVPALEAAGYRIRLFAGRDARHFLRGHCQLFPVYSLLPGEPWLTLPKLVQRTLWATVRGARRAPSAVISDGDVPSVIASAALGIPTVALGHGLLFSHATPPCEVDQAAWAREAKKALRASFGSTRQVVLGFGPAELRLPSARLARPRVARRRPKRERKGGIVCYFRDASAREALKSLRAIGLTPLLFSRYDPGIPGVVHRPLDRASFLDALAEADAVISSGGYQLLAECLAFGVPHFALFRRDDDEQRLNVAVLRAAGLADGGAFEETGPQELLRFLGRLVELRHARRAIRPLEALRPLDEVVLESLAEIAR
jgi:UDP-N-acetylglucosamine--N-acetylmuramyl-(pentapeptide) pyrophosphoryl-undecaprenol N-acetylglucosamine transferase